MGGAACLVMALIHAVVWWKDRAVRPNVVFAVMALAVALFSMFELALMRAETPEQYDLIVRWIHAPAWVIVVCILGFVRLYLRAGRRWLAWTVVGVRTLSLILNFVFWPNINYRQITALRQISFLGESVSVAEGVTNPWVLIAQLSLLLLVIFVADATVTVWRRGDRLQAVKIGGSILLFVVGASTEAVLITWGVVSMPMTVCLFYQGIVAAMGFELSYDIVRAAQTVEQLRASEAALRESEERMGLAAEAGNLGLWVRSIATGELWMTEKGRALLGFAKSEILDFDRFLKVVHGEDRARIERTVNQASAGGGEYEADYRIVRPDGEVRWIAGLGRVEFNQEGKPICLRGVVRDITLRKQTEEALKESEVRFRNVANAAPVMIWMSGPDKLCKFFNKGWLDFTGRTMEEEVGNGWAEGVHADDLEHCFQVYQEAFDARQPFTMEYRLRRNDGEYRWVLDSGTALLAEDGGFLGYIGSCIDISERKQAEEKFRIVLDAAPNAMIMVDSTGLITFANGPAATVFGYSDNELVGCSIEKLIPERFHPQYPGYRKTFLSHPNHRAVGVGRDFFGLRKDGSEFPVEIGLNPIHTAQGLFVLASVIDITARKQAELDHERQHMELARVGRLAVMGELAASLAHEVNNPIGAMVANANAGQRLLAAGKIAPEEVQELLADIVADGHRAREVVQGVRNMVRKSESSRSLIRMKELIEDVLRIVRTDAVARQVTLTTEIASNAGWVMADRVQLLQVLLNLTINAFEAMSVIRPDGRRLLIHASRNEDGRILVRVRDSGPGIPGGVGEHLFEPFFSTKAEGTGMGLAIARSIVEAHGGALSSENCDGGGACFTVRLPEAIQNKSSAA